MRLLKEKEGCDFVYMTGSHDQAMQRVRLHKRYRTKPVSSAEEFQKKPAVTSDGDIICPKQKTAPFKKNQSKMQNSVLVPWVNNRKEKTNKNDDIIWFMMVLTLTREVVRRGTSKLWLMLSK